MSIGRPLSDLAANDSEPVSNDQNSELTEPELDNISSGAKQPPLPSPSMPIPIPYPNLNEQVSHN